MSSHKTIKSLFQSAVRDVVSHISDFTLRPGKDLIRNRKFPADKLISFLVSQGASSTRVEMLDFFGMDPDEKSEEGSGQGSICSLIIANIYMHYVLLWWFKERVKPTLRGYAGIIVYADDFVCCFQHREDAERFYERLKHRMKHFGLELEESKSRLIEFGRYAGERREKDGKKPETFTFLRFTHYCSRSRNGKFRVKRKTSKKKFAKKCKEVHRKVAEMRTLPLPQITRKLNEILVGYYHYYGITDNIKGTNDFCYRVKRSLFYWLNRRSQKKSYSWEGFNTMLKEYPLARPKIYVSIYEG